MLSAVCGKIFGAADRELLLRLLHLPTVNSLEAGPDDPPPQLWRAQRDYARAAEDAGLRVIEHGCARADDLDRADVPETVRRAARQPGFLEQQPSLVLRLGADDHPRDATVMFNVHLDTVAGIEPVGFHNGRFTGRGAIDAKGPAVSLLAGVRAAITENPELSRDVGVLVQVVSGEEGGAMGTYGSRLLVEAGHVGRINLFCEPTGTRYLPRATASSTARISVTGTSSIDDRPDSGHNATVLLGFLAQHLADELDTHDRPGRLCVAGLHTGQLHNRVYGTGELLLNLSHASSAEGQRAERDLEAAVTTGLAEFSRKFADSREFSWTAAHARTITRLDWLKRGLPSLHNVDADVEELFARSGIRRWPDAEPAFTCDAIWLDGVPGTYTAVLGPGSLDDNNAHAEGEYADLADLDAFAAAVRALLLNFAQQHRKER